VDIVFVGLLSLGSGHTLRIDNEGVVDVILDSINVLFRLWCWSESKWLIGQSIWDTKRRWVHRFRPFSIFGNLELAFVALIWRWLQKDTYIVCSFVLKINEMSWTLQPF